MKLKMKFFLWMMSLITLAIASVGIMMALSERQLLKDETEKRQNQILKGLVQVCEEALYQNDEVTFFNYLKTLKSERGFIAAGFIDEKGFVRMHSDPNLIGSNLGGQDAQPNGSSRLIHAPTSQDPVLDLGAPVQFLGQSVGTARIFLSKNQIDEFLRDSLRNTVRRIFIITALALVATLLFALWLAKTMVTPINEIVAGMKDVSKGKFDPLSLTPREDELGWLGKELNHTLAQLKDLDEMKRNFFSRITHELRSPLGAIHGLQSMVLNGLYGPLKPDQMDALLTAQNNTNRLSRLIDDLLTASKLEANKEDFEFSEVRLMDCVEEVVKLYRPQAQEKGLRLNVQDSGGSTTAWADREKVLHVLINLVSNAIKYTAEGQITIVLSNEAERAKICVEDSGVGVSEEDRPYLFDRFFRSKSTSQKAKGSGLGLCIVKNLIERQRGTIVFEENPAGGSKFIVSLPTEPSFSEDDKT